MCKHLQVSTSGYYEWRSRSPSARQLANAALCAQITQIHQASDATYGAPRVHAQLGHMGQRVNLKRVERLMRVMGLQGVSRRRGFVVTTKRNPSDRPAPDLVQRCFTAADINQLWVADMTYIPTWQGFLYLAVVVDACSRKVVGWAFGTRMTADLVIAALNMALYTRCPEQVIHHSDMGSQYTSIAFGKRREQMKVRPSMGSVGDAYDNAMAESFFATLECELIDRRSWPTKAQARLDIFSWIESWYNQHRLHSGLGYLSPAEFERRRKDVQPDTVKPTHQIICQPEPFWPQGMPHAPNW
ncbi:putative transposase [Comamonas sp. 4034]